MRGRVDVLKYVAIPLFDKSNLPHIEIAEKSKEIHLDAKSSTLSKNVPTLEYKLDSLIMSLFS